MAEMYSKNQSVSYISYKLHIIKQTVKTINCNDYMNLRLNFVIAIKHCDEAKFGIFICCSSLVSPLLYQNHAEPWC